MYPTLKKSVAFRKIVKSPSVQTFSGSIKNKSTVRTHAFQIPNTKPPIKHACQLSNQMPAERKNAVNIKAIELLTQRSKNSFTPPVLPSKQLLLVGIGFGQHA